MIFDKYCVNHMIEELDKETQAQLNWQYSRNHMMEQMEHRREMEQMKKEIIDGRH